MLILSAGARRSLSIAAILACSFGLSACDYVSSFAKPKQTPEEAKAEGMALGAGCRQAGQTLETCYANNDGSSKAGIFAGWKDMHEYMAAKNIATVYAPGTQPPVKTEAEADAEQGGKSAAGKDAGKDASDKDAAKSGKDGKSGKDLSAKDSKDGKSGKDAKSADKSADSSRDFKPRDEKAHDRADRARTERPERGERARSRDDSSDKNLADSRTGKLADPSSR